MYEKIRAKTGWTYREIGEMSLTQMRNVLNDGVEPPPRITSRKSMKRVLERFKRGEFK